MKRFIPSMDIIFQTSEQDSFDRKKINRSFLNMRVLLGKVVDKPLSKAPKYNIVFLYNKVVVAVRYGKYKVTTSVPE